MMRSAADFLPLCMTTFMNLASMSLWNFGSGRMTRIGAWERRDIVTSYGLRPGSRGERAACARAVRTDFEVRLHFFGRLAPYLERLCFLSATPAQSSVPRTV